MVLTYQEYLKRKKEEEEKKKKEEKEKSKKSNGVITLEEYAKRQGIEKPSVLDGFSGINSIDEIGAPVHEKVYEKVKEKEEILDGWFEKSEGNLLETVVGSATDLFESVGTGLIGMGEKAVDGLMAFAPDFYKAQTIADANGLLPSLGKQEELEDTRKAMQEYSADFIKKDLYDESKVAKSLIGDNVKKITGIDSERTSVFGDKSDSLAQSAGQLAGQMVLNAVGLPWFVTSGLTSAGSEMENALNQDAEYEEALGSSIISAGAEILTEKISGGIKFGGKTLDDAWVKPLTEHISNKTLRTLAKVGFDATGEGAEEVVSQIFSNLGSSLYKEGDLKSIIVSPEALDGYVESFVGGAVLGGGMGGINALRSNAKGVDYATELTENEKKVVDVIANERIAEQEKNGKKLSLKKKSEIRSEVETEMDKGYLDIDKIESILGGDDYKTYKDTSEKESRLQREIEAMKDAPNTIGNVETRDEMKRQLKELQDSKATQTSKEKLNANVRELTKRDRLAESYNEKGRRGAAYEADFSKYDERQRVTIQKAVDSGILNNTNRTHEFVDMIAKLSADKGVSFDFTNNQKLKESGFAIEGKTVNGYVQDGNITLNVNSGKALNKVVGHEITHVLEGTELYSQLQDSIIEYAKSKGDYDARWENIVKLYRKQFEGQENDARMAQYKAELTSDLVGDYLFSDPKFVSKLSAEQPNIFQKVYDEIKYLVKVATAGSKEAKQLLEVQRAFEKAYKETSGELKENTRFSLGTIQGENKNYGTGVILDTNIFDGVKPRNWSAVVRDYVYNNLAGTELTVYNDGVAEKIQFAKKNERATKDGAANSHRVVDKLARNRSGDNIRNLSVVHVDELVEVSEFQGSSVEHSHQWLDENGWEYRTAYAMDKSGKIYEMNLNIAKSRDGRKILYDINKINEIDHGVVASKGLAHKNQSHKKSISQNKENTTPTYSISEENLNKVTDDGLTMTYVRVPNQNTKNYGSTYGQNIEPAGEYMSMDTSKGKHKIDGYEYGTIQFKKPLVLEHINTSDTGWKKTVSDMYNGLTGKKLSKALIKDGYDAIVTYDEYGYSEIVNLNGKKLDDMTVKNSLSTDEPIAPARGDVYGKDISLELPIRSDIAPVQEKVSTTTNFDDLPIREDVQQSDERKYEPKQMDYPPKKVKTVAERNEAQREALKIQLQEKQKLANEVHNTYNREIASLQDEIQRIEQLRINSHASFNKKMSQLRSEYDAKPNKNTKAANELLQQIENTRVKRNEVETQYENQIYDIQGKIADKKRYRADSDANYEKAVSDLKARIEKMDTKQFKKAEKRMTKQQEYRELMGELIGDTSTWVDKKMGIYYKLNTLRRNLRDIVRDKDGNPDIAKADAIYDEIQGKYNQHEAQLNREANEIKKRYRDMKITKEEDAYIQMLGEYRHNPDTSILAENLSEYYNKHKDKIDTEKVDKIIDMARDMYDGLFVRLNEVLREQGMQEISYHKGYFPHFTEEKQSPLAKLLGWKTKNDDIPTDIAGLTENFNPDRSWQSFNKHRTGDSTDYSFMKGLDNYVQGSLDWIYHIEDIQKRRALENEIRYRHSDKAIQEKIEAINQSEEYGAEEAQEMIDMVLREARNPLNNFVSTFRTQTNTLAGKKSSMDREMEQDTNRRFYSTVTNLSNRVTANMVGGSVSSALTNFIPITQSWAEVSPVSSLQAMKETLASYFKDDGTIDKSDFLTNRLRKNEALYKSWWDKAGDKIGFMMEACDNFTSQTVWRSKYMENVSNGMSESEAIKNADQFCENIMAGRSRGNAPAIFDSKNPITKMLTAFQLEVNNQYQYMFKDLPQEMQGETKRKLVAAYGKMFVGAYVYNAVYSTMTGRDAAFDPIGIIESVLRDMGLFDDDEEKEPGEIVGNFIEDVIDEVPFIGGLMGGGRIPISSALPYDGIGVESIKNFITDISEGDMESIWEEMLNPVFYLLSPAGGGGQIKKTYQGLSMFSDDLPIAGSYTKSGKLRFSVNDDIPTRLQAAVFGQYANENAREYFDKERSPLSAKQTQELVDLDIPIKEYWEYRDGLKGLDTLAEKADYIANLDFPIDKKNIMVNNQTSRKEPIDLTDYQKYGDLEELDFATKNPEKWKLLNQNKISYEEYSSNEEVKEAFDWAAENPEKYQFSQAVSSDLLEYRRYTADLNGLRADKDQNGKSISGSRKTKVISYLNSLDVDDGAKMILFKTEYPSDDTYNYEIVEYLNNRKDISYMEMEMILKELGFTIEKDGTVRW